MQLLLGSHIFSCSECSLPVTKESGRMDNKRQLVTFVSVDAISNECCASASAGPHNSVP